MRPVGRCSRSPEAFQPHPPDNTPRWVLPSSRHGRDLGEPPFSSSSRPQPLNTISFFYNNLRRSILAVITIPKNRRFWQYLTHMQSTQPLKSANYNPDNRAFLLNRNNMTVQKISIPLSAERPPLRNTSNPALPRQFFTGEPDASHSRCYGTSGEHDDVAQ